MPNRARTELRLVGLGAAPEEDLTPWPLDRLHLGPVRPANRRQVVGRLHRGALLHCVVRDANMGKHQLAGGNSISWCPEFESRTIPNPPKAWYGDERSSMPCAKHPIQAVPWAPLSVCPRDS